MTHQTNADLAARQEAVQANPLSDEYVNAVIQRHGYASPESVIAQLHQWIGLHGGEDSVTLLMYETHRALSALRAPVTVDAVYTLRVRGAIQAWTPTAAAFSIPDGEHHLYLSPPAPPASEAQCSCPSGDGSLRYPCAVHPQTDRDKAALGIPECGGPLCGQAHHHPLCRVASGDGEEY